MEMQTMTNEEVSVREAAEILGVHPDTVYSYVRTGTLPARRIGRGGRWRISRAALTTTPEQGTTSQPESPASPPPSRQG